LVLAVCIRGSFLLALEFPGLESWDLGSLVLFLLFHWAPRSLWAWAWA
jgi:hypothetical protein